MSTEKRMYANPDGSIIIENRHFILKVSKDAVAESLVLKNGSRELLDKSTRIPIFSITEDRPYNNEIKLMYPCRRTTFGAKSVELREGFLDVHFDLVSFGARVEVTVEDEYVIFGLKEFIITDNDFLVQAGHPEKLNMDAPPVKEFRLLSLSVKRMEKFGQWLNVTWDDGAAVAVIGTMPSTRIGHEKRDNGALTLTADAIHGIKLKGCSCALICTEGKESMLDAIGEMEEAFDLPRGVKSRREPDINRSTLWVHTAHAGNIDKIIEDAKAGNFKNLLFYYTVFFKFTTGYRLCGDYDYNSNYTNGDEDVKALLKKVKDAGLVPGLHFLHTHIGIESRYVTPVADHRLNLTRHFTLAKPVSDQDSVIYVEQTTEGAPMHKSCRVLQFGGELIHYESYTDEPPYAFLGCERGYLNTTVTEHPLGLIGGTLDVSEFGATSVYVDQNSSLQDEVSAKLAALYNLGFEFCYMDGSEGTSVPFDYHISNAQYRTLKLFDHPTLFCEGAAKTHFGWHWMSGGNAFDTFPSASFKQLIAEFPFNEALRMKEDFTRVNFGWWNYWSDIEPDMYEYGMSRAASVDCPITLMYPYEDGIKANARTKDNFEVIRRWEEYRPRLTEEEKLALRDTEKEHTLIKTGDGLVLLPYERIEAPEGITAYVFEHNGKYHAAIWHKKDSAELALACGNISYRDEYEGNELPTENVGGKTVITVSDKAYLTLSSKDEIINAIADAVIL